MPLYTFLHNLPNVLVQIANKIGLKTKKNYMCLLHVPKSTGHSHPEHPDICKETDVLGYSEVYLFWGRLEDIPDFKNILNCELPPVCTASIVASSTHINTSV
jgi:hypothetical protein